MRRQLDYLGFENKKENDSGYNFIHSDPGHKKADNPRENKQKSGEASQTLGKKGDKLQLGYKLHSIK